MLLNKGSWAYLSLSIVSTCNTECYHRTIISWLDWYSWSFASLWSDSCCAWWDQNCVFLSLHEIWWFHMPYMPSDNMHKVLEEESEEEFSVMKYLLYVACTLHHVRNFYLGVWVDPSFIIWPGHTQTLLLVIKLFWKASVIFAFIVGSNRL